MLNNYTYKQKNIALIGVAFLFALISYFGAIKNTVSLINSCSELEDKLIQIKDAPKELALIERQLKEFEILFGKVDTNQINYQPYLLETISNYCNSNDLILKEFPKPLIYAEQDFIIETNKIILEGEFIELLKLIYLIEQTKKLGNISNLHFQTFTRTIDNVKQTYLSSTFYLQHIIPQKNEK